MPTLATPPPLLGRLRLGRLDDRRLAELAATGDERAFEVLYDRYHRALLGFCRHMLRSSGEAEDALQQTFLRAHRSLVTYGPPAEPRPWLFKIARNLCRTLLASRRPVVAVDVPAPSAHGPGQQVQTRADLRAVLADVERLPDNQRAALVLAELGDLSHEEIAGVIGVRTAKVKALIYQARSTLIAERDARDTPCEEIREQIATAQGSALRRGPVRRHLRGCEPCRAYRTAVADQRRALALALPVTPSLGLKAAVLGSASAVGGAGTAAVGGAGTAASLTGGFTAKLVAGALLVGGGATGGAAIVDRADPAPRPAPAAVKAAAAQPPVAPTTTTTTTTPAARVSQDAGPRRDKTAKRSAAKRSFRRARRAARGPSGEKSRGRGRAVRRRVRSGQAGRPAKAAVPRRARRPARVKAPKVAKPARPVRAAKPADPARRVKPAKPAKR